MQLNNLVIAATIAGFLVSVMALIIGNDPRLRPRLILAAVAAGVFACVLIAADHKGNTTPDNHTTENHSTASRAALSAFSLISPSPTMDAGKVAGDQLASSPTLYFTGSGCSHSAENLTFSLQKNYSQITFRYALDDTVSPAAHAQVEISADGALQKSTIITPGSGGQFAANVSQKGQLSIRSSALTHTTTRCAADEYRLHIFDVVAR